MERERGPSASASWRPPRQAPGTSGTPPAPPPRPRTCPAPPPTTPAPPPSPTVIPGASLRRPPGPVAGQRYFNEGRFLQHTAAFPAAAESKSCARSGGGGGGRRRGGAGGGGPHRMMVGGGAGGGGRVWMRTWPMGLRRGAAGRRRRQRERSMGRPETTLKVRKCTRRWAIPRTTGKVEI